MESSFHGVEESILGDVNALVVVIIVQFFVCAWCFLTVVQRGVHRTGRSDCHSLGRMGERVVWSDKFEGSSVRKVAILMMSLKLTFLEVLFCKSSFTI